MSESTTNPSFERAGGEAGVRRLVDRFYDIMDGDPVAATIRALHPDDLTESRQKLYEFLCGWLGGPQLYIQKRGHPRLRARHLPFSIGFRERDEWMHCMIRAMDEVGFDPDFQRQLAAALMQTADFMRNREESA
ncbi:MAG: group II truncated hemoglobin [Gammaproteobacteria bacterium]